MPARNSIKQFESQSYYHLYNRGNNKEKIFYDDQDYAVFLSYLKTYLLPKDEQALQSVIARSDVSWRQKDEAIKLLKLNNFSDAISLLCYCLMPNHFHFLVYQEGERDIDRFMNSLGTRYSMYFNKKHKRVGQVFQGIYKAVKIESDEFLLHLSRYIHRNSINLASQGVALRSYGYSSFPEYVGVRKSEWVDPQRILSYFGSSNNQCQTNYKSYEAFVLQGDIETPILFPSVSID